MRFFCKKNKKLIDNTIKINIKILQLNKILTKINSKRRYEMKRYIKIFFEALIILSFFILSCSKGIPYEETQLISQSSSDDCVGSPYDKTIDAKSDSVEVEITVEGFTINITHKNAIFNCCIDSIKTEFTEEGDTLELCEVGFWTNGCYCTCPFEVHSTIGVSAPGVYLIEIWGVYYFWPQQEYGERWFLYQEWVEVTN